MSRRPLDIEAYNRAARNNPCFICGIIDGTGEPPHHVVYRDEVAIAFLNRFPTVYGYVLVAPIEHRVGVVADFDVAEYLALQSVVHRVGRAVSAVVPTERLYVLSLGANQGNAHVHWHLAPLPPDVAYEQQQFAALMVESTGGYLDLTDAEQADLADRLRAELGDGAAS